MSLIKYASQLEQQAIEGSIKSKCQWLRPSRIGKPTVDNALIILSDWWNKPVAAPEDSRFRNARRRNSFMRRMASSFGFFWEAFSGEMLTAEYPDYTLASGVKLTDTGFANLEGTADLVLTNQDESHVIVVDAKALAVSTKRDGIERLKHSGYTHQLAIYRSALTLLYPNADVDAMWHLLCRNTWREFLITPVDLFPTLDNWHLVMLEEVEENTTILRTLEETYNKEKETGDFGETIEYFVNEILDYAPLKEANKYGNFIGVCDFHFHYLSKLIADEEGYVDTDKAKQVLTETAQNIKEKTDAN